MSTCTYISLNQFHGLNLRKSKLCVRDLFLGMYLYTVLMYISKVQYVFRILLLVFQNFPI
jgi:hypothetical protein